MLGERIAGTLEECRDCIGTLLREKGRTSDDAVAEMSDEEYLSLFEAIRKKHQNGG